MQKKHNKNFLSLILSMMLIVAMAFGTTACSGGNTEQPLTGTEGQSQAGSTDNDSQDGNANSDTQKNDNVLGEGATVFDFIVVDKEGKETSFEIHTDKTTVGDALLETKLIAGEEGTFGLYVKTVNGITADYDADGTYWAFCINGEMAMTGVDSTNIEEGATYSFKVE